MVTGWAAQASTWGREQMAAQRSGRAGPSCSVQHGLPASEPSLHPPAALRAVLGLAAGTLGTDSGEAC